ncbi:Transcriptional regulator ATRX [Myotis davidii]|uniref:Transcriptional regulator ATRX n=1 Tax=Myotis davidii TaxID=225400 RepID=L5MEI9_MYODS|nr:Transcriptional regulator ATRX [Myotis davidii]
MVSAHLSDRESKLNTLVQKLHDFLAHSSEESEETSSPPRPMMSQSTGPGLPFGHWQASEIRAILWLPTGNPDDDDEDAIVII